MNRTVWSSRGRGVRLISILALLALLAAACGGDPAEEGDAGGEDAAATDAPADAAATDAAGDATAAAGEGDVAAEFYQEGDTITLVVPFDTGGGTDTLARIVAPPLSECLGADIQVQNIPGGGSVLGANEYQNQMEPDGYNLLMTSASTHVPPVIGQSAVEYSFDALEPVAGFPQGGVIYAGEASPIDEAVQLTEPQQPEQITYAGQPATGGELRILLIFEMFNTDVNAVLGFEGRGPARIALERGESDIGYDTNSAYLASVLPLVEEGTVVPLMSFGQVENGQIVDDPNFPDLPNPAEVYEEAFGESPEDLDAYKAYTTLAVATLALNKAVVIHEDAPPEAIAHLDACWEELKNNQEFLDQLEVESGVSDFYAGEEADAAWGEIADVNVESPEIQWLLGWVEETYDVRLQEEEQ